MFLGKGKLSFPPNPIRGFSLLCLGNEKLSFKTAIIAFFETRDMSWLFYKGEEKSSKGVVGGDIM